MTSSMGLLLGQQQSRRMRQACCVAHKLFIAAYRSDGIRAAVVYKSYIDERAQLSRWYDRILLDQSFPATAAQRRQPLRAGDRHDDVGQHSKTKTVGDDAAELPDEFHWRWICSTIMPIGLVQFTGCGQPGMGTELNIVHGTLHATTHSTRRGRTDADASNLIRSSI